MAVGVATMKSLEISKRSKYQKKAAYLAASGNNLAAYARQIRQQCMAKPAGKA